VCVCVCVCGGNAQACVCVRARVLAWRLCFTSFTALSHATLAT
jgi:hypothetical protein